MNNTSSTWQRGFNAIREIADFIKHITTIFGFISAIYLMIAQTPAETKLSKEIIKAGDTLINAKRFSQGYLYYEVGSNGKRTGFGELTLANSKTAPEFEQLTTGQLLKATGKVYLRPEPTKSKPFTRVLGIGQCFLILEKTREIKGESLGNASSGGWLHVEEAYCPGENGD